MLRNSKFEICKHLKQCVGLFSNRKRGGDEWKKRHPPESICGRAAATAAHKRAASAPKLDTEAALLPGDITTD